MHTRFYVLGRTALHMAARWGHLDVVELLLSHGADPAIKAEVEGNDGPGGGNMVTARQLAEANGHVEVAQRLTKASASLRC